MSMPLEGIKVVELAQYAFGPRTAGFLKEMGADVVKIESTEGGDPVRGLLALKGVSMYTGPYNAYIEQNHRGKRGIALDLHHEKGREVAHRLIEKADVFVTNLRAGGLKRLGMDYDTLSSINPGLVYAMGTGWGLKGAARERGAFEGTGFARSGAVTSFVERGAMPVQCPPAVGDYMAAAFLAYAIMLGLFHRERTGEGQLVHTSLLGSFMKIASLCIDTSLVAKQDVVGTPHNEENAFYNGYRTKDGRWIQLALIQDERAWSEFCETMGIQHLEHDARFDTAEKRAENKADLIEVLDAIFLTRTYSEWIEHLEKHQFPWAPVRYFTELTSDQQVLDNDYLVPVNDPVAGEVKVVGVNVDLSRSPGRIEGKAPELGQHTEEVLLELGYTWEDIASMKEQNVIL
ncbi:MAG: CoA transferase [Chloroflexota bacterium]|nr:CoA transferase [Chloroflexota bacterium]